MRSLFNGPHPPECYAGPLLCTQHYNRWYRVCSPLLPQTHTQTHSHAHIQSVSLRFLHLTFHCIHLLISSITLFFCSGKVCEIFIGTHAWQNSSYNLVAFVVNGFSSRITLRNKQPQSGKTIFGDSYSASASYLCLLVKHRSLCCLFICPHAHVPSIIRMSLDNVMQFSVTKRIGPRTNGDYMVSHHISSYTPFVASHFLFLRYRWFRRIYLLRVPFERRYG